jgi:hypothetical protein
VNRIIAIKSNVKAIGWLIIFVFSIVFLYSTFNLAGGVLMHLFKPMELPMDEPLSTEINDVFNLILNINLIALLVSVFMIVSGKSILDYKLWAVYTLHFISAVLVIGIIVGIIYLIFEQLDKTAAFQHLPMSESNERFTSIMIKLQIISTGTIGIFVAWVITRMNLLLLRREYLVHFK